VTLAELGLAKRRAARDVTFAEAPVAKPNGNGESESEAIEPDGDLVKHYLLCMLTR
jgi:hypothetical protein